MINIQLKASSETLSNFIIKKLRGIFIIKLINTNK